MQEFIKKYKERVHRARPMAWPASVTMRQKSCATPSARPARLKGADIAAQLAKTKDFDGVTGKISIDANRNAVKPAVILEMKNGKPIT